MLGNSVRFLNPNRVARGSNHKCSAWIVAGWRPISIHPQAFLENWALILVSSRIVTTVSENENVLW